MVGSESSWALGRSQAALNARALGLFSAQGADGKPIFYGSKVAFEEDQGVPFSVVGWAVAQAAPVAVIERFNKVGLHPADTLMLANPERLVSIERHEALEGAGHWEFLRAYREEKADGDDGAWRAEIERLERESAAYEARAMEGKEAARPLGAVDEKARAEEAAAAQDMAGHLGFAPGAVLAKDGRRYRVEAVVNPEGGPCAVLSDENGERRDVARRLRELEVCEFDGEFIDCGEVENALGLVSDDGAWYEAEGVTRLADLIEPSEPKVRCVAEAKFDGERLEQPAYDAAVERTCHLIHEVEEEDDEFFDTVELHYYVCSECGRNNRPDACYCDSCGAKVVER